MVDQPPNDPMQSHASSGWAPHNRAVWLALQQFPKTNLVKAVVDLLRSEEVPEPELRELLADTIERSNARRRRQEFDSGRADLLDQYWHIEFRRVGKGVTDFERFRAREFDEEVGAMMQSSLDDGSTFDEAADLVEERFRYDRNKATRALRQHRIHKLGWTAADFTEARRK